MSYSISTSMWTGKDSSIPGGFEANLTYNVSRMLYDAFGPDGIRGLNGMQARDAESLINTAIIKFYENIDLYKSWNPPNDWGSYDRTLELLENLRQHCEDHPNVIINIY